MQGLVKKIIQSQVGLDLNISYSAILSLPITHINLDINYSSSNEEWGHIYYKGLILDCPLVKHGIHIENGILPWDFVAATSKKEKFVVNSRKDFNIINGISFIQTSSTHKYSIAIGTDYNKDFYSEILMRKTELNELLLEVVSGLYSTSR